MSIGDRIKKVRTEELRMSQVDLAKAIGVSKQTLYKYENRFIVKMSFRPKTVEISTVSPAY